MADRWEEIRDKLIQEAASLAAEGVAWSCARFTQECESPIEKILACHIASWKRRDVLPEFEGNISLYLKSGTSVEDEPNGVPDGVHVWPQAQRGPYRVDFLIYVQLSSHDARRSGKIIVECDGHDFHERTKEQAARDRARDRSLIADGYTVIRFTGSELHRDSYRCAKELEDLIYSQVFEGYRGGQHTKILGQEVPLPKKDNIDG